MLESLHTPSSNQLQKWVGNFIRHTITGYDEAVSLVNEDISGAYQILKTSVLDKIAKAYPFLKEECERQKSECYYLKR